MVFAGFGAFQPVPAKNPQKTLISFTTVFVLSHVITAVFSIQAPHSLNDPREEVVKLG